MVKLTKITQADLDDLYNTSAFTVEGAGGDLNEWTEGINTLLKDNEIGEVKEFVYFTGEDMNNKYNLTGSNAYPNDLTFLAFKHDGLDVGKLAMFKLQFEARWFDDIVDNNANR